MNADHLEAAKNTRIVNLSSLCGAILMIIAVIALIDVGLAQSGFAECQSGFTYLVEADNGGYYALVGLPLNLNSQYGNHTTRMWVNGTFYPATLTGYLHPPQNYRGLIYVTQYGINGVTYNYAQTAAIVSGTEMILSTNTNQISPTTMTIGTSIATLTSISVMGWLDYTQYCITEQQTTTTSSSSGGNSSSIPGFTLPTIILGLIIGTSIAATSRRKKVPHPNSTCMTTLSDV